MLREELVKRIEASYEERLSCFGEFQDDIRKKVGQQAGLTGVLLKFMYATLPLSDIGNYDFEIYRSYAEHGVFLYENSPYVKGISDEIFLNYVVSPRINNEDITDCRRFFHDLVKDRIKGMDIREAALSLNNFAYENATYHSTSERTAAPITVYKGGYGRCGEESTFYVSVLRSVGIPSRQVYVPRWSHSDSNHAWTEIYVDGEWLYTGACEPKPVFNNGWFSYAASRAMIIHSRVFGDFIDENIKATGKEGAVTMVDNGELYSRQKPFTVHVTDEKGEPVKGAKVRFEIVNSSELFSIVSGYTDDEGRCTENLGLGDVHLYVTCGELSGAAFADASKEREITVALSDKELSESTDGFTEFTLHAPESDSSFGRVLTKEEEELQAELDKKSDELRNGRIASYFDPEYAKKFEGYTEIIRVLKNARGNIDEIMKFLDTDVPGFSLEHKNRLFKSLAQKDTRDIPCDILLDGLAAYSLEDAFHKAFPDAPEMDKGSFVDNEAVMDSSDIMDEFYRADMDFFTEYVASPKISTEKYSAFRRELRDYFGKEIPFDDGKGIWAFITENVEVDNSREYGTVVTTPLALLKLKRGSAFSREVLFVALCRTCNIPARLDMTYKKAQYFSGDRFIFADDTFNKSASVRLTFEDKEIPDYCGSYSLSYRKDNGDYYVLNHGDLWINKEREVEISLVPGYYRLVTSDRLVSGGVYGKVMYFKLDEAENKSISIKCRFDKALIDDEKKRHIGEVTLKAFSGKEEKLPDGVQVLMFLKAGTEPTEHVLNELMELSSMDKELGAELKILVADEKELKNDLMERALSKVKHKIYWIVDEITSKIFGVSVNGLTNYPYICLIKGGELLFETNGYQIGIVDILQRMIEEVTE